MGEDQCNVKSGLLSSMMHVTEKENHNSFDEVWQETLGYCEKSSDCFCDSPTTAPRKDTQGTCKAAYIIDSPPSGQDQLYHKPNRSVLETANASLGQGGRTSQSHWADYRETRVAKLKTCSLSIKKVIPTLTFSSLNWKILMWILWLLL